MIGRAAGPRFLLFGAVTACGAGAARAPPEVSPSRAQALELAVSALARSHDVEALQAIAAALERDHVCPDSEVERRVRCHLARPTVEVSAERTGAGWTFTFALPDLSDHLHRARVWRRPDGTFDVEVESQN
ncbi:MAG TPA: hypothetical protein VEL05_01070 [Candidatus Acidoferrum sp.]|nr:hypothetical protein [Candidatus Acidoferrum sp.]